MPEPMSTERLDEIEARNSKTLSLDVDEVGVAPMAFALSLTAADVPELLAEVRRLRELTATCTCGTAGINFDGPQADCPVCGAVRAFREASTELERLRADLDDTRTQAMANTARVKGLELSGDYARAQRDATAFELDNLVAGLNRDALVELLTPLLTVGDATAVADRIRDALDVDRFENRTVGELTAAQRTALGYTAETVAGGDGNTYRIFRDPDGNEISPDTPVPPGMAARIAQAAEEVDPDGR